MKVGGTHGDALVVRVTQPAHDGQANEAVVEALAGALGLARGAVTIEGGATARRKRIGLHVRQSALDDVHRCLDRLRSGTGADD
jgi:uncharacterized protein YggU (UPF0235/DUF167 family)